MKRFFDVLDALAMIATATVVFATFLKIVQEMSPVTTILFVVSGTLLALGKWTTGLLSISGLILYAISWPSINLLGIWPAQLICMAGILTWFTAYYKSILFQISRARC